MKNKMRISLLVAGFAGLCNVVFAQSVDQGKKFLYYQRYKSAKDVFDKILASNPNNIDAIYWDGQTSLANKDSVGAQDLYSKALQTNGNAPLLLAGMGDVELRMGKATDAKAHFETAISLSKAKDIDVFNAVGRANVNAKAGDAQYAIEKLTLATQVKKFNDAETYVLMGDAYRKLIDGGNAVTSYNKALGIDPKNAEAEYKIGKIYLTQNNKEFFMPAFQKATDLDPAYAPAYYEIFYYYYNHWNADDVPKAKDALDKYVANSDPGAYVDLLQTDFLIVTGKFADARTKAQGIISAQGGKVDPNFYKKVAYCCDTLGDAACATQNIATYFTKQDTGAIIPQDYVLRASIESKAPDSATKSMAFADYALAIQKDTLPEDKARFTAQASDLAKKLGNKKATADLAAIVYSSKKSPTNSDLYAWGMANYQAGNFKTSDSIFCGMYETLYPTEIYGYLWCMRSKQGQDDSVGSNGYAVEAEMKLAEVARSLDSTAKAANSPDSIKFKKYAVDSYSLLAFYYNNTKKDKGNAIAYLQKILEVDPSNADAKKYIDMLSRPPRKAAATTKAAGTK
jgi:cytochrome c-type biogenesis protein CcmH/NrfG